MHIFTKRLSPALVISVIALIAAVGGGYAIGAASKIQTSEIAKQAVTNKKIAKKTIKASRIADNTLGGQQIDESTLGRVPRATTADSAEVAGTGRSTFKDGVTQIDAPSAGTTVLSLDVPAGSYLFIAKGVLAKAGLTLISCTTAAGTDTDTSSSHIDASANDTIVNTVVHTFDAAGTAVFQCSNPDGNPLFVTNAKLTAIPFADLENVAAP
jgi:hypothetical protein